MSESFIVKCVKAGFMSLLVVDNEYRVIETVKINGHNYYAVEDAATGKRVGIGYYDSSRFAL